MKMLAATDGSDFASAAMLTACKLFRSEDRDVDVLCVAPEFGGQGTGWDETSAAKRYRVRITHETQRILDQARSELEGQGIRPGTRREVGLPGDLIVQRSAAYDVTVLGAQGHGEHSETGLGPVASYVLHHAPGSVLIGRELHSDEGFRVLIAVDGSAASVRAVEAMTALLDLSSAEVTLMHVVETPWVHLGLDREWLRFRDPVHDAIEPEIEWDKDLQAEARQIVEAARDQLRPFHPGIDIEIAEGLPADEILSESEKRGCDLIVVGATGMTDLKHQLLGSVSHRIARDAACSVLVVKAHE